MKWGAYCRLMRLHKPIGMILLWIPTAWALWVANQGNPPWTLVIYFLVGTMLMRSAGCVVNDLADRHVDPHVKRTAQRPLATGEIGVLTALVIFLLLLMGAFFVVIALPSQCFYLALIALTITLVYPFCKRFLQAPQLVLGFAFSMGIPMAFVASNVSMMNTTLFLLFILNFAWIVSYDTMYAMVDRQDDQLIGVKSTAILMGSYEVLILGAIQLCFHFLWLILAGLNAYGVKFYLGWLIGAMILAYQQKLISTRREESCFKAFITNAWYGLTMWVALI